MARPKKIMNVAPEQPIIKIKKPKETAKVTVKKTKVADKLNVSIGFVISEALNKKIEKEVKAVKAKNKSELFRTILEERYKKVKTTA